MKLFRRDNVYLIMHAPERAWTFDASTGVISPEKPATVLMGGDGRDWLPVLETDPIPLGLARLLIVKY